MERTTTCDRGLGERVARALLSNPRFKADLRRLFAGIDPAHAPGLARALLWQDAEALLGLASALPRLFNFAVAAAGELIRQLNTMPPAMLQAFLSRLASELDLNTATQALSELRILVQRAAPVLEELKKLAGLVATGEAGKEGA